MTTTTPHTVYRKDYQPYAFSLLQICLQVDLYEAETFVQAEMQFKRERAGALRLYGDELTLVSIALDGQVLSDKAYHFDGQDLILEDVPETFQLTIQTKIFPQNNTHLSGLYRSNGLFCTQCEAHGFRRIMYFPDRPDVLTFYTTKITADKKTCPILLSNGNCQAAGDLPDGRHWVEWVDPFKKPSYLFALVAGDLVCARDTFPTEDGRDIDLRLYVEPGQLDKTAHALESLKHAMRWDEQVYGRLYDLEIFMIVAVSDFNMGAMENKGLNIFNAKYILASPETATDMDYSNIEEVVGHEYFHNWTGNRVTCRDWFQLSLKEGLTVFRDQEFSRDRYARDVKRIEDVKLLRQTQFPEDASPLAHPVRPESYEEINNFYTATVYNKGAEVIRMQHTLLGVDGFRKGMDLYFKRHDGEAVTIDDFVAAMSDANGVDLTQFKRWYSQAGTPEVRVTRREEGGTLYLTFQQSCPPTPGQALKEPFCIPIRVAAYDRESGREIPLKTDLLVIHEEEQSIALEDLPAGAVISLLRDFSAPIKLFFEQTEAERLVLLQFESNGFSKWEASQQLALSCITQHIQSSEHPACSTALSQAYLHVLEDDAVDLALRASLLTPPSFEEVAATFSVVEVDAIENARQQYREVLAQELEASALATIERLWQQETHDMTPESFGKRRLRHVCLALLCQAGVQQAWTLCKQQFQGARTMTDEIAALGLLVRHPSAAVSDAAIERFYQQWQGDALVLDKWFTVQAMADKKDALQQVQQLLSHPKFSLKNPNKVRALIGGFTQGNPRQFHAIDGSGYAFLADMLLQMDAINPQVSARLVTPLTRFRRFDAQRQKLMRQQLEALVSKKLSKDLTEMITKTLQ